jgi:uncharacterized cupin superfamily protein
MSRINHAAAPAASGTRYPAPYDAPCRNRSWLRLGEAAGLTQFGVNQLHLAPGSWSSQRHWHSHEDEFVMVLSGEVVLVDDSGEATLRAGDSAGFPAGVRNGHYLQNRSSHEAVLLIVGTRHPDDHGEYPDIDLKFTAETSAHKGAYVHKDDTPY